MLSITMAATLPISVGTWRAREVKTVYQTQTVRVYEGDAAVFYVHEHEGWFLGWNVGPRMMLQWNRTLYLLCMSYGWCFEAAMKRTASCSVSSASNVYLNHSYDTMIDEALEMRKWRWIIQRMMKMCLTQLFLWLERVVRKWIVRVI